MRGISFRIISIRLYIGIVFENQKKQEKHISRWLKFAKIPQIAYTQKYE